MAEKEIVKQGFLVKKGHLRHNWRTRWFELTKQGLRYYRKKEDKSPAGTISLAGGTLAYPSLDDHKKPWLLQIKSREYREYLIQAPDKDVRDEWTTAIEAVIRQLDTSRDPRPVSGSVSSTRNGGVSKREIVQALQDPTGGVRVREFLGKGARQTTKYFTGRDILDWLISWSFATSRSSSVRLASSLLKHGYFNPVQLDFDKGICVCLKEDGLFGREVVDSEDTCYIFVCFAPGENMDVFDEFEDNSDSDSDDDLLSAKIPTSSSSIDTGDGKILKQGFLRKKGHLRHNWKARLFVLKEKQNHIYYYRGSKQTSKPLGTIPLRDLTILELDNEGDTPTSGIQSLATPTLTNGTTAASSVPSKSTKRSSKSRLKVNHILLTTATGVKYELEAATSEDRDSWVSEIKIASKLITHS